MAPTRGRNRALNAAAYTSPPMISRVSPMRSATWPVRRGRKMLGSPAMANRRPMPILFTLSSSASSGMNASKAP